MKRTVVLISLLVFSLGADSSAFAAEDMEKHPSCRLCGMDRRLYAHSRMVIEYDDRSSSGTCSLHCTAAEMAAHREKTIIRILAADFNGNALIDAKTAYWVIGGSKDGVMTKRAKWAFRSKGDAEAFILHNGGSLSTFPGAMKATFEDMYEDIGLIQQRRKGKQEPLADVKGHPECIYCGMDRQRYARSRMLIEYDDGAAAGTCSIHCTALDLSLNSGKTPKAIMVGDYATQRLIDAEHAIWVVGGSKAAVMSIRGKWAFKGREDAEQFVKDNGGMITGFDDAMKAAFEDMYEILR